MYASGNSRLPIYAGLALAVVAFVVGAMLVVLARPAVPTSTFVAGVPSASPESSLPIFTEEPPSASPEPTPTAPPLFPTVEPTIGPSLEPTPVLSPEITPEVTPEVTPDVQPTPTPTSTRTPRPTRRPTPTPVVTPTPPVVTPTPPATANCSAATGNPTANDVIGYGNRQRVRSEGWCVDSVTFRIVFGSTFGTVRLLRDGRQIASYDCNPPSCTAENTVTFARPRLVNEGFFLAYDFTCSGDPATAADECAAPDAFRATIQIFHEPATP